LHRQLHCAGQESTNEPNHPHGYRHFRLPNPSWMTSGLIRLIRSRRIQEQVLKDHTKFGHYPAMDANWG
jgi:hypothetical protein